MEELLMQILSNGGSGLLTALVVVIGFYWKTRINLTLLTTKTKEQEEEIKALRDKLDAKISKEAVVDIKNELKSDMSEIRNEIQTLTNNLINKN